MALAGERPHLFFVSPSISGNSRCPRRFGANRGCDSALGIVRAFSLRVARTMTRAEKVLMAYVVCAPCSECKYTDCVVVCPVDCFYQDAEQLYIDPEECIDCGGCVPECPV